MQAWHQRYKYQIAFHSIKLLDHLSLIHTSCRSLRLLQRARPSQAVTGRHRPSQVAVKNWNFFYLTTIYCRLQQIRSVV